MQNRAFLERLSFHNPWWGINSVPDYLAPEFKREMVSTVLSYFESNRVILLKGPRRVGKTTIFYQIIDILLKGGLRARDICYISLDDPLLRAPLDDILKSYEDFRGEKLSEGTVYFFLDEAQFLKDWELTVKLYIDRRYPIKFLVSGSSVSLLTQKIDSLAGRTVEETLFPFSFKEFLSFFSPSLTQEIDLRRKVGRFAKSPIDESGDLPFPGSFNASLVPFVDDIRIQFKNFLEMGGFPHIYSEKPEYFYRFLKDDILDKVVFRDLVELYNIREPSYLERLFYYLGKNTASLVNLSTLSQTLGVSRPVIERYISYLERALLYFRLPKFSASLKESLRSNPKGHLIDPSLCRFFGASEDQIFETAAASFLFTLQFGKRNKNIYFWRDQNHEVDVIIEGKELIPVEIKNVGTREIPKGLFYFMKKHEITEGFVIYQGDFHRTSMEEKHITFYPAWYFFLHSDSQEIGREL